MKKLILITTLFLTNTSISATNDGSGTSPDSFQAMCYALYMDATNDGSGTTDATNDGSGTTDATNDGSGTTDATNDGSGTKPDSFALITKCMKK